MAPPPQTYANHPKLVPMFHVVLLPILLINFLAMAYHLWREPSESRSGVSSWLSPSEPGWLARSASPVAHPFSPRHPL